MFVREVAPYLYEVGARDPGRRLFDELIPLPEGTSYNSYLIKGSGKTALIDSVDPTKSEILLKNLKDAGVFRLDYIISNHAEQDHSGTIPELLEKYPDSKVVTNAKCREFLMSLLHIKEERFIEVKEGDTLSLGNKTLEFIMAPWVHWPETMLTYLVEDKILFSCDFFGSHFSTDELFVEDEKKVYTAAKRYYAEIMMPFRKMIKGHLKKLEGYEIGMIAPSHGPLYQKPEFIIDAYKDWVSDEVRNNVIIAYVSMHGSTKILADRLERKLKEKNIHVRKFNLTDSDIGEIAIELVDSATIVLGSPTVLTGPHPSIVSVAYLANALRPKTKFAAIIGSFGWAEIQSEKIKALIPNLKVELLSQAIARGLPTRDDLEKIDELAEQIYQKHKNSGLI
ncbi:MAG: FprA family A-type flavoprotein [Candidatus Aenigmarchaeota archaeon]|nr:FprA family A-type flavoprotein [Candidatus Aenigmarchaeota archaeon]